MTVFKSEISYLIITEAWAWIKWYAM
jgi:hypothetical protein